MEGCRTLYGAGQSGDESHAARRSRMCFNPLRPTRPAAMMSASLIARSFRISVTPPSLSLCSVNIANPRAEMSPPACEFWLTLALRQNSSHSPGCIRRFPASHSCHARIVEWIRVAASVCVSPAASRAARTCSGAGLADGPFGPRLGCDAMSGHVVSANSWSGLAVTVAKVEWHVEAAVRRAEFGSVV